jgi:biuret amidohydrolase
MREIHGKLVCETLDEVLEPDRCAVLVIDMQKDLVDPAGKIAQTGLDMSGMYRILPRCAEFIEDARALDVPVVHIQTVTMLNGASDSPSWIRAKGAMVRSDDFCLEGTWGAEICDEVAPLADELVVTKHRSSAFLGTNLNLLLRSRGIETVVLIGEQTPGCVEATFRDAAYHDYYNVLVEDCVAAFDQEQHDASILIQRRRHDVCTARDVLDIWYASRGRAPMLAASVVGRA